MSKTNDLAIANGWESDKLAKHLDSQLAPMVNTISDSTRNTVDTAVDMGAVAVHSLCSEGGLPHASRESVIMACIERITRSKTLDFLSKQTAEITLFLLIYFTDAMIEVTVGEGTDAKKEQRKRTAIEQIKDLLDRNKFATLLNRAKECKAPWILIDRLHDIGIKASLANVRKLFRNDWFITYSVNAAKLKRNVAETMFGFTLADSVFIEYITGSKQEYMVQGVKYSRSIPSKLELFERASAADLETLRKTGTDPNTRKDHAFDLEAIKAVNDVALVAQLTAEKIASEKKVAEAREKAEAAQKERERKAREIEAAKREENTLLDNANDALNTIVSETLDSTPTVAPVISESDREAAAASLAASVETQKENRKADRQQKQNASKSVRKALSSKAGK